MPDIYLDGIVLPKSTKFKYLGSIVNQMGAEADLGFRFGGGSTPIRKILWNDWTNMRFLLHFKNDMHELKIRESIQAFSDEALVQELILGGLKSFRHEIKLKT